MTKSLAAAMYEMTFAESDKTDAILVIDEKKLHVNQALLSYHSDYFKTLFASNSGEKSSGISQFKIDDVKFEDFATLLSLVQHNPLKFTESNSERLLELAVRFELPAAKRHVELFLITIKKDRNEAKDRNEKLRIADKYGLDDLLTNAILMFKVNIDFRNIRNLPEYKNFSDKTKVAIFHRLLDMIQY